MKTFTNEFHCVTKSKNVIITLTVASPISSSLSISENWFPPTAAGYNCLLPAQLITLRMREQSWLSSKQSGGDASQKRDRQTDSQTELNVGREG